MTQNDTSDIALKVVDVAKSFKLPTEKSSSLKGTLFNWIRGRRGYTVQEVLRDISFEVHKGDFFGIVGKNGSGKSTLLKIISQIYTPDSGSVEVNGKLVPFIELGVGFNPELTGRENVYLNGAMLGFSNDEIEAMYDDIVEFAELGDFMEQKLENYSSGMQVRLAFSVAIKSRGDILVLDEVLAVGDEAFQKKCQDFFFQAKREHKTIILVTHSMNDVRKYCNHAILIDDGRIALAGTPDDVANAYSDIFLKRQEAELKKESEINGEKRAAAGSLERGIDMHLDSIDLLVDGKPERILDIHQDFVLQIKISCDRDFDDAVFALNLVDQQGRVAVALSTTTIEGKKQYFKKGMNVVSFAIENVLPHGDFFVNVAGGTEEKLLIKIPKTMHFSVKKAKDYNHVLIHPHSSVSMEL